MLGWPPIVTTTFPVVAPPGTGTTMLVADQLVGVAVVPLNVTALVPLVAPKFDPVIVTDVPTGPLDGATLVTLGTVTTDSGLKAARTAPQISAEFNVAAAETDPADACTESSTISAVFGATDTASRTTKLLPAVYVR